ncbi:MAG: DUF4383 domain-containing protein [Chloroflexi bacterium]|nr:DUF4383 domain-containing protein [Chloroflexota bacterium]
MLDFVHVVVGIPGIAACRSRGASQLYARGLAIFSVILTAMGFIRGLSTFFGAIPLLGAEIGLHTTAALVPLASAGPTTPPLRAWPCPAVAHLRRRTRHTPAYGPG